MTDEELIQRHLATKGVIACPPGIAAGLSVIEAVTGITAVPLNNGSYRERMAKQIAGIKANRDRAKREREANQNEALCRRCGRDTSDPMLTCMAC